MSNFTSEAIVLQTWPIHEADLLVALFTRDHGLIRGVAKSALRSRKRFGGALEPMTSVRAAWAEKPRQELVRLDSFEILSSPLSRPIDYARAAALALYAEVLLATLPDHDPQDAIFRLTLAVLEHTGTAPPNTQNNPDNPLHIWMPVTYFSLWITRLLGYMPDLATCIVCGERLTAAAFFHLQTDGLTCARHKHAASSILTADSQQLARRILRQPIAAFSIEPWPRHRAGDLRRFSLQALERHIDHRLTSAAVLCKLGS